MDGIIVMNKDKGCTSHDVVYNVKKLFGTKVGHTGTLDPNATGVLPILIGKGTELSQFLINHDKKYIATIKLGQKTDTGDIEGNIIDEKGVDESFLNSKSIKGILKNMIGKQKQKPPIYSAVKINGKKLYEYARNGKVVNVPEREIEIYDLKLIDIDKKNLLLTFEIFCSKGTYVRTVCEQIAENLNTVGFMKELKRTVVGNFTIENSITISELKQNINNQEFMNNHIISIEKFFETSNSIIFDDKKLQMFLNGVMLDCDKDGIFRVYDLNNKFIGIGISINNKIKRKIVV